jgi:hypothetical protein
MVSNIKKFNTIIFSKLFYLILSLIFSLSILSTGILSFNNVNTDGFYRESDYIDSNNIYHYTYQDNLVVISKNYNSNNVLEGDYVHSGYGNGVSSSGLNGNYVRSGYGSGVSSSGLSGNYVHSGYGSGVSSSGLNGNYVRSGYGSGVSSSGLSGNYVKVSNDYLDSLSSSRNINSYNNYRTHYTPVGNQFSSVNSPNYEYYVRIYKINTQRYSFDTNLR